MTTPAVVRAYCPGCGTVEKAYFERKSGQYVVGIHFIANWYESGRNEVCHGGVVDPGEDRAP